LNRAANAREAASAAIREGEAAHRDDRRFAKKGEEPVGRRRAVIDREAAGQAGGVNGHLVEVAHDDGAPADAPQIRERGERDGAAGERGSEGDDIRARRGGGGGGGEDRAQGAAAGIIA
jgi:hypothetical protein